MSTAPVKLFDVQTNKEDYGLRAVLSGEVDLSTVDEVEEKLRAALDGEPSVLVMDLREVSFLDSSGLRMVLKMNRELAGDSRRLIVIQGERRVAKVFELTGAHEELEIVDDPSQIAGE